MTSAPNSPSESLSRRRLQARPFVWMALFIGIPLVAVPGYAIYCRSWRPILHWLGAFIGAFAISALIYFGCELAGFAYEDSWAEGFVTPLIYGLASGLAGLQAARQLRLDPKSRQQVPGDSASVLPKGPGQAPRLRGFGLLSFVAVVLPISCYGAYRIAEDRTIMQNPILASVESTSTKVLIKHSGCDDTYGYYDLDSNQLVICTAIHGSTWDTSKESTIRHEAWHLVQACVAGRDNQGRLVDLTVVNHPGLIDKSLDAETEETVKSYPEEQHLTEREARLAELYLTDKQVIDGLVEHCGAH